MNATNTITSTTQGLTTSRAVYRTLPTGHSHQEILAVLEHGPATANEIEEQLGLDARRNVRARLRELKFERGLVIDDTLGVCGVSGRTVAIWRLAAPGEVQIVDKQARPSRSALLACIDELERHNAELDYQIKELKRRLGIH